jgi:serine/threonine protein kinase
MLQEGAMIGGRYRLLTLIGEGGMASVWRAEDETLKRAVAIKVLFLRSHRDPQSVIDQFLREARLAASVQHRNVIHTVDFGVTEDHMPFMVMELLHGESLADRMLRIPRLRMDEVVHIANLTLRGLAAVHEAGIVHRDLKPQNVFLQRDTETVFPKILDFGISRSLVSGPQSAIATQQGLIVGTPEYMAPEQARGEADIDRRADIYAMGAIIYEGITGRVPFESGSLAELIVKIVTTRPPTLREKRPDVPELISDCVAQAMSPDREARFADAAVFRRALSHAAERSFGSATQLFISDSPPEHVPHERPLQHKPALRAHSQPLAAGMGEAPAGWGGFSELDARGQRRGSTPRAAAVASLAASPPAPALGASAAHLAPPNSSRASTARLQATRPEAKPMSHDASMFGDNPLDTFAGEAGALELDISGPNLPRMAGVPNVTSSKEPARPSPTASVQRSAPAASTPSAALWILPALLLLGLLLLLFAPGLFSLSVPDAAAAARREAENPATQTGPLLRDVGPRPKLGTLPPAQRDVAF